MVERFKLFCTLPQGDANRISSRFRTCLDEVLPYPEDKQRLIAQCYDDAGVTSGCNREIQAIFKQ